MKTENGGTFVINNRDQLEVRDYLGKRYASLKLERQAKDGKTYINRMNFDEENWEKLINAGMRMMNVQNTPTKKYKTLKRRKSGNKEQDKCKKRLFDNIPVIPTITQYNWQYGKEQSPCWYFTEEMCKDSGDFVENKDELQITTRQIPLPSIVSITEMITTYLVSGDIRRRTISTCYGCSVDHPSQLQHMDNGCMMDWEDAVTQYYEEAFACVTLDDVVEACNKIITVLDLSMSLLDQVICVPEVKMHVLQVGIPQDFELLFKYVLM